MQAVTDAQVAEVIAFEDAHFEIDPGLSAEERDDHARMQVAIEQILVDRGFGAYTAHFDAIGEDGRFGRLPLAAASSLMAKGYGYAAEGDVLTACLVSAGHMLIGDAHFTEMYAMDFPSDSILMSHMGEGNWKIARSDRPVKLIKRPLGIGRLADPPTFLFQYQPGPATLATLVSLEGDAVPDGRGRGREPGQPGTARAGDALRPVPARLRGAGLPERLAGRGRPASRGDEPRPACRDWKVFCQLAGIEFVQV